MGKINDPSWEKHPLPCLGLVPRPGFLCAAAAASAAASCAAPGAASTNAASDENGVSAAWRAGHAETAVGRS